MRYSCFSCLYVSYLIHISPFTITLYFPHIHAFNSLISPFNIVDRILDLSLKTKKNRALKRAGEEMKHRKSKEDEIQKLEIRLREINDEEQALREELEKNQMFQEYLESVVINLSKFFPEIQDVIKRHTVLVDCNKDLILKSEQGEQVSEQTLRDFMQYRKEKENAMLTDSNAISTLQVAFENKASSVADLQTSIDHETQNATDKSVNLGQILTSVTNILERADSSFRIRHNKPQVNHSTNEHLSLTEKCQVAVSKLDEMLMFMGDYNDIVNEYKAEISKGHNTNRFASGGMSSSQSVLTINISENSTTR